MRVVIGIGVLDYVYSVAVHPASENLSQQVAQVFQKLSPKLKPAPNYIILAYPFGQPFPFYVEPFIDSLFRKVRENLDIIEQFNLKPITVKSIRIPRVPSRRKVRELVKAKLAEYKINPIPAYLQDRLSWLLTIRAGKWYGAQRHNLRRATMRTVTLSKTLRKEGFKVTVVAAVVKLEWRQRMVLRLLRGNKPKGMEIYAVELEELEVPSPCCAAGLVKRGVDYFCEKCGGEWESGCLAAVAAARSGEVRTVDKVLCCVG